MRSLIIVLGVMLISTQFHAQESSEAGASLNSGTLQQQFDYMVSKSNRYKNFKVIKQTWLNTYWSHVSDSLQQLHTEISKNESMIAKQSNEIDQLKSDLTNKKESLATVESERDNITFLGAAIDKSLYKQIMWGIAFGLLGLLILTMIRYNNSNRTTKSVKLKLAEIEEDFDSHKRRALEKEQQLKRELQNQINKLEAMSPGR